MDKNYLYHYTNTDGLLGIIQDKAFWASKSSFMNDPSELNYARELIDREVKLKISEQNLRDVIFGALDATLVYEDIYLVSFSLTHDTLSMWNLYGKNDGYCLCIDADKFDRHIKDILGDIYVGRYKIIYDDVEQREIISATLQHVLEANKVRPFSKGYIDDKDIVNMILSLLFSIKHPCYKEESEMRCIFSIPNHLGSSSEIFNEKTKFRSKDGIIWPFIEIPVEPVSILEKVILSPINNSSMSLEGLNMFLMKHVGGKGILSSNVPFRKTSL